MKNTLAISLLMALAFLSGCASTGPKDDEPLVTEAFEINTNSSFAKNVMKLAGSNKFVDSTDGNDITRTVRGGYLGTAASLAQFDLFGALSNSATNSLIENEPLVKGASFFLTVPVRTLELSREEQEVARNDGNARLIKILKNADIEIKELIVNKRLFTEYYASSNMCDLTEKQITTSYRTCKTSITKGIILRTAVLNGKIVAVIRYQIPFANQLIKTADYLEESEYFFMPLKVGRKVAIIAPQPFVLNKGRVHYFKTGAKFEDGQPLSKIELFWYVDESISATGSDLFFSVDMDTLELVPVKE
ncbi:hypothetical protein ACMAZF_20255 (plasmid) [Psychrobium sp. nBUS_13]|uniref:hypothetical protein n=1 Tax=Psychrobium sp. nBUS_13 TaxID=3395319 RepID=UPI003EB78810